MSAMQRFLRLMRPLPGLAAAVFLASCGGSGLPTISVGEANTYVSSGYLLAPGDRIMVTVFDEPNLTGEYSVGTDGRLAVPLIDPIQIQGRTVDDIAADLAASLV